MVEENKPQNEWKRKLRPAEILLLFIVGIGTIWFLASNFGGSSTSVSPPSSAPSTARPSAPAPAPEPVVPSHNYVYVGDDGQYGYQQQLSTNDQQAGVAQKPLVMVRYLGQKNGTYRAIADMGGGTTVLVSCKAPCTYMDIITYSYGAVIDKSVVPLEGTLGGDILEDAIAGELKIYHSH